MAKIHPTAYQYVFPLPPHKGKTFGDIAEQNPAYLDWMAGQLKFPENLRIAAAMTRFGQAIDKVPNLVPVAKFEKKAQEAHNSAFTRKKPELWIIKRSGKVALRFPADEHLKGRLKHGIDGFQWDDVEFAWTFEPSHLPKAVEILGGPKNIIVTESIKAAYKTEVQRRLLLNEIQKKKDSDLHIPTLIELYNYQKVAIEFGLATNLRFIDADQMGLGKTPTAIGIAELKNAKTLVVCPRGAKRTVWERQIKMFAGKQACVWDTDVGATGDLNAQYHVIHYDAVKKWLPELLKIKFDLLVCDEAHKLKNYKSQRTKAVLGYWPERKEYPGIKTKWVVFLTGTPLLNRPPELYTLLHYLDPKQFNNPKHFIARYGRGTDADPARNKEELFERIRNLMIRRLTKNIRGEVAKKQRFDFPVELTDEQMQSYLKFEAKLLKASRGGISATQMPHLRNFLFEYKFPILCKFVEEMNDSGRRVLIWTIQREHAERIAKHFGPKNIRMAHGGMREKEFDQNIRDLQDGKVMNGVLTVMKNAEALDGLQHHMDAEIFVDEWFVPGINEQAEDRLNRVGQKNPVHVWYMQCVGTIDEIMRHFVAEKQRVIDEVVDGQEVVKAREVSVWRDMMLELARRRQVAIDPDAMEEEALPEAA